MSNIKETSKYESVTESVMGDYAPQKPTPVKSDSIVVQMEKEWPEMTKEFRRLQKEQYELFLHKQHDYGPGNISVGTQLQTEEEIHLSLTGLWFRMNDKIQRLKTLLMGNKQNAVDGEPMEDAYLDVSNYGIMATIVKNGKWGQVVYKYECKAGVYKSDTLFGLVREMFTHRLYHLINHGKWMD